MKSTSVIQAMSALDQSPDSRANLVIAFLVRDSSCQGQCGSFCSMKQNTEVTIHCHVSISGSNDFTQFPLIASNPYFC